MVVETRPQPFHSTYSPVHYSQTSHKIYFHTCIIWATNILIKKPQTRKLVKWRRKGQLLWYHYLWQKTESLGVTKPMRHKFEFLSHTGIQSHQHLLICLLYGSRTVSSPSPSLFPQLIILAPGTVWSLWKSSSSYAELAAPFACYWVIWSPSRSTSRNGVQIYFS